MGILIELGLVLTIAVLVWSHVDGKNDIERLIDTAETLRDTINAQNDIIYTMSERIAELERAQDCDGFE
jgi:hypothetical protein